jgi:beta-phosphoglucomutase-like phosphatase (HAD superfamily)
VIKALIFDFDGLIIDSESPEFEAWHELFAEYGRELGLELWADLVGRPPTHFDLYGYFVNTSIPSSKWRSCAKTGAPG